MFSVKIKPIYPFTYQGADNRLGKQVLFGEYWLLCKRPKDESLPIPQADFADKMKILIIKSADLTEIPQTLTFNESNLEILIQWFWK